MSLDIDSKSLNIPCPKCGDKTPETIGNIKNNATVTCSGCGISLNLKAEDFREGIEQLEASIANLKNVFKGFKKR